VISLVTIAYNEAHRMQEHLELAAVYCDELVVVVQDSDDGTADIVSDFGAKLLHDECQGASEPSRTLAFANVDADWIMYLDADEHLDPPRIADLPGVQDTCDAAKVSVYSRVDGVIQNPLIGGRYHANRQVRFFNKNKVTWGNKIHQRIFPATDRVFVSAWHAWVVGDKAGWEQDLDNARYTMLEEAERALQAS
jgi:glycosyltransferase involved in cell wall biosynthesis